MKRWGWVFVFSLMMALGIGATERLRAQIAPSWDPIDIVTPEEAEDIPITVQADRIEYEADRGVMIGIGNVLIEQGEDRLHADYVEFYPDTRDAVARGRVRMERGDDYWTGDEFEYNFRTRTGDFGAFRAFADVYHITARESQRVSPREYHLQQATFTTCEEDDEAEFVVRARRARIVDETILHSYHAVAYMYRIPILYTPYWRKNFAERSGIDVLPGYSSRMGAFLLTGYRFYLLPYLRSNTQLDYRTRRGFGYGQNFRWQMPADTARGELRTYYTDDDRPIQGARQVQNRTGLIDHDRYRLGLMHIQSLGERNALMTDLTYLSDPFVQEDFFEEEAQYAAQPENRVTLFRRGDNYSASLLFNMRLNDFYNNVNRLPEATLDIYRQQIFDSPFYYEGRQSAAYLERVHPEGWPREDYDAIRADSLNLIYYPTRHFGFLNITPNVGYRGTYYSDTFETVTATTIVPVLDDAGEPVVDEETGEPLMREERTPVTRPAGADIRHLYEFGVESSFKAFKVLTEAPNYLGEGLRHVVEPFAHYSYIPEPNLRPGDLPQFDLIDRLDKQHHIMLGVRNKLQTRRLIPVYPDEDDDSDDPFNLIGLNRMHNGNEDEIRRTSRVHDMIDLNTYTFYRLEPEQDERDFSNFFFDARLHLADWVRIRFDGEYDWYEHEIDKFNTQVALIHPNRSTLSVEYRYDRIRREMLMAELSLFPERRWSLNGYWRYDIGEGELEEQSYLIERRFNCTGIGIGIRERDDEIRIYGLIWLLAFDRSDLQLGR